MNDKMATGKSGRGQALRGRLVRGVKHPRTWRIVAWTLGVLLLLAALAAWGVPRLVRGALQEQAAQAIGRPISVGQVSFNPFSLTLRVRELAVSQPDGPPLLTFVELEASAAWASVFRFAPVVDRLILRQPRLVATREDATRFSFSDIVTRVQALSAEDPAAPPKPDTGLPRFSLNNVELLDGSLLLDDKVTGRRHVIDELTLGLPFLSTLAYATDIDVLPRLHARINGSVLDMDGTTRPFEATRPSSLHLRFDGLALQELADAWPLPLAVKVERALLDSDLQLTFAQAAGAAPTLRITGRAGLRELDLRETGGQPLLGWRALGIEGVDLMPLAQQASVEKIVLDAPVATVRRNAAGALNWQAILPQPAAKAAVEPAPAKPVAAAASEPAAQAGAAQPQAAGPAAAPSGTKPGTEADRKPAAWQVKLGAFILQDGRVPVQDDSLGFTYALEGLGVQLDDVALPQPAGQPAALRADVRNPDGATLALQGSLSPQPLSADLQVQLEKLPLKVLQPVLAKAGLGWQVDAGTLGARTRVRAVQAAGNTSIALSDLGARLDGVTAQDTSAKPVVKVAAQSLAVTADRLTPDLKGDTAFKIQGQGLQGDGRLTVSGVLTPAPLSVKADVDLAALELSGFAPYIASSLNATVRGVALGGRGKAAFQAADGKTPMRASWRGDVDIGNLRLDDRVTRSDFLRFKQLSLARSAFSLQGEKVAADLGDVTLDDFYGRVILSSEGTLNLSDIVANPGEAGGSITQGTQTTRTEPAASGAAPDVSLRSLTLRSGKINFTDRFVKPNYTADLTRLQGTVSAVSSTRPQPADVKVKGRVYDNAPFSLEGKVQPFGEFLALELRAIAQGVDLPTFTTYSAKYVGYPIERGKLSVDVTYKVEDRKLTARNKVVLNQLTFGPRTDSPDALKLPVLLAVSLLKDRHGNIDINLPVSGSLDDPEFSVGGIIVQVFINLISKAVTAPFSLLASAFGGGEELSFIAFEPGSAVLSDAALANIDTLSAALADRPALKLDVSGRADPAVDADGLRQAWLDARLRQAKAAALSTRARKVDPDTVKLEAGDEARYLEDAYDEADIEKPRNFVGIAKSLPAAEMKALMLAAAPAGEDALRTLAEDRARAVMELLMEKGPADRIFLVAPRLDAKGVDDGGATSRVDFSLK
ncbi:putative exported protein [plant metagenome]|uniref:Putative exported protein n=1 Tax=plant metagenome TaxID=1297885 RepID=A0A484UII0_9ZZZZ